MATPLLIYCAGGSRRFGEIARAEGFAYGCRSDHAPSYPPVFVDLDWRKPDLDHHLGFVALHQPRLAVAPDVTDLGQLPATLRYAEQLARYVEKVILVPKVPGMIERLPREPWLLLGYSVPTRYGGADGTLLWEWAGWPVHLLGGSPAAQLNLAHYLDVFSADGNAAQRAALRGVWFDGRHWRTRDAEVSLGPDLPYRTFARSCAEIVRAWQVLLSKRAGGTG